MLTPTIQWAKRAAIATCLIWPATGHAQDTIALDSLMEALVRPAPETTLTRSLGAAPEPTGPSEAEIALLEALPTRGLTIEARQEVVEIVAEYEMPRIDLDIPFDYDSAHLRADVIANLAIIGQALTSEALAGRRIILAGHTDGVGSASYNQALSERRAIAVRAFLIDAYGIPEQQLVAVGFGFEQLRDSYNPAAAENRRVEVINLEVGWN